jgi:TIR domain
MAYVPGCRYDLFISYAVSNNRDGWIDQFEKALGDEMADLLGRQFNPKESIFFDKQELQIGHSFPDQLAAAARQSAILIPVLSPGYLTSLWCNNERTAFFSSLPDGANPESCLAPILLRPIDERDLDALYRHAQRVSFLSPDGQTPFAPGSPEWVAQVRKFAGQLKNVLQGLRRGFKPVFIGQTAAAERLQNLRTACCSELERRHFRTVPESLQVFDDVEAVRTNLQEAGLAVHFLGGADPAVLEAIELSVELCAGPTILYQPFGVELTPNELVWLPDFEQALQLPARGYQRLAGKNDQELLALIDEQIRQSTKESPVDPARLAIALVCDESDLERVRQMKSDIRAKRRIEVDFPNFLGTRLKAMDRLRKWQEFLSSSPRLLFYYGSGQYERLTPIWLKAQQDRPEAARHWFVGPPDVESKRQKYPDALWELDQVISLVEVSKSAGA